MCPTFDKAWFQVGFNQVRTVVQVSDPQGLLPHPTLQQRHNRLLHILTYRTNIALINSTGKILLWYYNSDPPQHSPPTL